MNSRLEKLTVECGGRHWFGDIHIFKHVIAPPYNDYFFVEVRCEKIERCSFVWRLTKGKGMEKLLVARGGLEWDSVTPNFRNEIETAISKFLEMV
jgi:hypothetical protein